MVDRLNYAWRVLATAICFFTFGIGGALMWVLVFPALSVFVRNRDRRGVHARALVRSSFAVFIRWIRWLGVLTYQIHGAERLQRRGLLVLANHPTLIDCRVPDDCIAPRSYTLALARGVLEALLKTKDSA